MIRSERLTIPDQRRNRDIYDKLATDWHSLNGWSTCDQQANFQLLGLIELAAEASLAGASCLDVGCGTGEMAPFLREKGIGSYLGLDVRSDPIILARERYPDNYFRQADVLVEPWDEKFDFVFCSGALTAKIPSGNYSYMEKMLARMMELANVGVAFNYLTKESGRKNDDSLVFLFDPRRVDAICDRLMPAGWQKVSIDTYVSDKVPQKVVFITK